MSVKFSYEYIKEFIEKENCKWISSEYKNYDTKLEILFICGHIDFRNFGSFKIKEKLCTDCISRSKGRVPRNSWNLEKMNQYCLNNNIAYKVLDIKWVDKSYQKQLWALVKCPNDNHVAYWTWWNNFKKGYYCNECYGEENNITFWTKEKVIDFYSRFELKIIDFDEWKDVDSYIYCINKDGYYVGANISNLKTYEKHPKWGPNLFKSNKYAIENIKIFCKKERPDYEILSEEYLGIKAYHLFKYNGIGLPEDSDRRFFTTMDCFYHGKVQHPDLNKTKAELKIETFLIKNDIKYKFQYTKHGCKNYETNWTLRFDFGIFDNENNLKMIIESDGTSHDTVVEYWGGEESLKSIQRKDEMKNNYCKDNNIKLLRINHIDDKDIEEILKKELFLTSEERRI